MLLYEMASYPKEKNDLKPKASHLISQMIFLLLALVSLLFEMEGTG